MGLKKDNYVRYAFPPNRLLYGRIIDTNGTQVHIKFNTALNITTWDFKTSNRIQLLPNSQVPRARAFIKVSDLEQIQEWLEAIAEAGTVAAGFAAPGLFGGAATMSGLATIGSCVGGGAVCGIVLLSAAPAVAAGTTVMKIVDRVENDEVTKNATIGGMVGAGAASTAGVVGLVSASGAAGLSGAGITSGLAAIGGGTIAAGGAGMAGGLAICSLAVTGPVAIVGLAVWGITNEIRQNELTQEYQRFLNYWTGQGYI